MISEDTECFREAAQVTGAETFLASRPFGVVVVPSRLVAGLPSS